MSDAISAATKRASACSSSTSTTRTGSPSPSSEKSRFGLRSVFSSIRRVRRAKDRVGRAVVLLERDDLRSREVRLELDDVADVGAAERVDRLILVADGAHVPVLAAQQLQQAVLRVVRVLVLVDEDVAERLPPALERLREALEDLHREHEDVVEVDGVRGMEAALVELVRLGDGLVPERRDASRVLLRRHELVLRTRDLRVDAARREALRVLAELLEARLDEPHLVLAVVDRERRAVAESFGLSPQHPPAGGVEREDPDRARGLAEHPLETLAHLARRLVRERDREDLVGFTPHARIRCATRYVSTRVFPEPAPATTSSGPSVARTASRWASLRSAR